MSFPVPNRKNLEVSQLAVIASIAGLAVACNSSPKETTSGVVSTDSPRHVFSVPVPPTYQPVVLRGVGSEFIKAPPQTVVRQEQGKFLIAGGAGFELRVQTAAPSVKALALRFEKRSIVLQADDALILKEKDGYAFVVIRQLVPEWDESDRRQYSCFTPGLLTEGVPLTTFAASEVGTMVAACRTLSLPVLE